MTTDLIGWVSSALIFIGSLFVVIGAVGILRLPDVFTRLHAASVLETTGSGFLLIGMMLTAGWSLVTLKLAFLLLLFFFTAPVATHAIAQAALHDNVAPKLTEDRRKNFGAGQSEEGG